MILVYCSATGFTQQYAQMLHQKTGLPLLSLEQAERELSPGSRIAFLGWLRAGSIQGIREARKRFDTALVCAVGMAPRGDTGKIARANAAEGIPLFYLRGGYAPDRVRGVSRAMMSAMTLVLRGQAGKSEESRQALEAVLHGADWVSEEQLEPVVRQLNG